jgi:3-hydroxymyristoyl/3-hydroxydecanoyl-(acyl carrier protein) dehydratase
MPDAPSQEEGNTVLFMSIDKVKFRKRVVPGDQLILELKPLRTGSKIWKMAGKAFVKDDLVAEVELMATIG